MMYFGNRSEAEPELFFRGTGARQRLNDFLKQEGVVRFEGVTEVH
jgi:hypothetical protein